MIRPTNSRSCWPTLNWIRCHFTSFSLLLTNFLVLNDNKNVDHKNYHFCFVFNVVVVSVKSSGNIQLAKISRAHLEQGKITCLILFMRFLI